MKISALIEDLDPAQWAEVQTLQAEYQFTEGMTHVCATFVAAPISEGLERHVEMPLMVFTKAVTRLAHLGHSPTEEFNRRPAAPIAAVWDRSEPRETGPLDASWRDRVSPVRP